MPVDIDMVRDGVSFEKASSYLTLVDSLVTRLDVFDLECPHAMCFGVERLEPIVRDERHPVHGQNVIVSDTNP